MVAGLDLGLEWVVNRELGFASSWFMGATLRSHGHNRKQTQTQLLGWCNADENGSSDGIPCGGGG